MENKKQVGDASKKVGGSSSSRSLDHLFGPKDPSSASSTGVFGSIFPPPSTQLGRDSFQNQGGSGKYGNPDNIAQSVKDESAGIGTRNSPYQNEPMEPCYLSSSIYYGGQENYSPRAGSTESQKTFRKDGGEDDSNNNANSASRGNWWQGSLYY
ncbi:uncharacterized protein LOC126697607 isoform X1 [Quercus robur]|uniref:uncharacterized protein LOC126697607 isoform X1 n=1 Tax=Quercus robur TaxID=38942 RepID=UPI0021631DF4|nr:uncharacterized protein LOC126697607 isoform X1 [Quercus robur]XP_050250636.1 uncharacterized protein LOC126697607 isoform X1 [Quercus robur]